MSAPQGDSTSRPITFDEILDALDELLEVERAAVQQLDAQTVELCALEKERLFSELRASAGKRTGAHDERLRRLVNSLRHNGVLLAHARDCVRDALIAAGALQQTGRPSRVPAASPTQGESSYGRENRPNVVAGLHVSTVG